MLVSYSCDSCWSVFVIVVSVIVENLKTLYFNFNDKLEFKVRVKNKSRKKSFFCATLFCLVLFVFFFFFFFGLAYGIPP